MSLRTVRWRAVTDAGLHDFRGRYGPWALVAGGANGIGAAFCRQLAAEGSDLVVFDRDEPALETLAAELRPQVQVVSATVDLALAPDPLLSRLRETIGTREIGLYVANAAWSPVGPFVDTSLDALLRALDVNCRAAVVLAHELGRAMAARGRGGVIVMSSIAAETGTAQVALYSATKAFALVLAEGLWYELRDRGVDVIAIRPGSTRTPSWESTQPPGGDVSAAMDPADVAREALAALGTAPSMVAGADNRRAEAYFRSLPRRDVIELMSSITGKLVPPTEA